MSFLFFSTWLLIRKYNMDGNGGRFSCLLTPLLVQLAYGATSIFPIHGGLRNPTIALGNWIWVTAVYGRFANYAGSGETRAEYEHVNRYFWIYIVAPLLAAPFAGLLMRKHLDEVAIKTGMEKARTESFFKQSSQKNNVRLLDQPESSDNVLEENPRLMRIKVT